MPSTAVTGLSCWTTLHSIFPAYTYSNGSWHFDTASAFTPVDTFNSLLQTFNIGDSVAWVTPRPALES